MLMHDVPYAYHCQSSAREIFFVCIFFHFLGPVSEIEISLDRKKKKHEKIVYFVNVTDITMD